ncbi:MAG TPA: YicC/YloC family endoribonuclease [Bryobacteraceae bacterium]|jgi:uncharacterized protein (TIGR00255 family)|nr:YicC/YloC family endoribonuclease [Bryobacteraceae bacterium]
MTGFAQVRTETSAGELTVSLRSVNHRGLDLHFHQIGEFAMFENGMRTLLKQGLRRGHVEIRMGITSPSQQAERTYNRAALARYVSAFRQACQDFEIAAEPDLTAFLRMPGVLEDDTNGRQLDESFEPEVLSALTLCIDALNSYREREGQQLRESLMQEMAAITQQTAEMSAIRQEVIPMFQRRLEERLSDLLRGAPLDAKRVVEEAAILADRSDIQEELTRLTVHTDELARLLEAGGEVGKRLDFLLQEMNREANTILSKTPGATDAGLRLTNLGLATKANIERIREQSLNLE